MSRAESELEDVGGMTGRATGAMTPIDRRMRSAKRAHQVRRYAASIPLVLLVLGLVLIPIVFVVYGSFIDGRIGSPSVTYTLEKLHRVYVSGDFFPVIINTLTLALVVSTLSVAVGAILAWLIARTDLPLKKLTELLVVGPVMLSPFVIGFAWLVLGSPRGGLLNVLYMNWSGADTGLFDITSVTGMVLVMATSSVAYAYFFIIGALRNVDSSLEEAARLNGASDIRILRTITLPSITPALMASFLFLFVVTAGAFAVPTLYGQLNEFRVLSYVVYLRANVQGDHGLAAASASVLVLVTMLGLFLYRRVVKSGDRFVTVSSRSLAQKPVHLGIAKWFGLGFAWIYGLIGIVLPVASLVLVSLLRFVRPDRLGWDYVSLDAYRYIMENPLFWRALGNTVIVVVAAPALTVVLGLTLALVTQRSQLPLKRLLDYTATIPLAIPGLITGLGILWATIRSPVHGTLIVLILAYTGRYLPQVYRICAANVIQVHRNLEESSALCGASALQTARLIVAPLLKPALFSSFAVASIFVLREVPTAVMLTTRDSLVLSVYTWDFALTGEYARASSLALVQVVLYLMILAVARYVMKVDVDTSKST